MSDLEALQRGELAGARHLDLSRAGLTTCPGELSGLADTLEVLDLSHNAITALPNDFNRLRRLRVLFCSGNRFTRLPPVLGDCPALSQLGFRATHLREIPAESLPQALRWLTVTDNEIGALPAALGERPALQKLMLAGNRIRALPQSLAGAGKLELLRLSANRFGSLPGWLAELPGLAWLAWAGNPFDNAGAPPGQAAADWSQMEIGAPLGEGASGLVYRAIWSPGAGDGARPVALKLFKGAMTSDGLPEREMAACLAAGAHPNLIGALGRLSGHPGGAQGLVMPLLPAHWRALAGPPSLESCSRDVYDPAAAFDLPVALRLARGIGAAAAHLHASGLLHGDLYAHNVLWDGTDGKAVLSDFGAASFLPPGHASARLRSTEILAWGLLLGELLDRCSTVSAALRELQGQCVQPTPSARPPLRDVLDALSHAESMS